MNDDQVCIAMLRPMRDHPLLAEWYASARVRADQRQAVDVSGLIAVWENPMLSTGERALIEVALAVRNWKAVNVVTTLGAMSRSWQHHVLAMLVTRLGLTPVQATEGHLAWVEAYDMDDTGWQPPPKS